MVSQGALRRWVPFLISLGEEPPKVTSRGGTFFALWLIQTLFVVKYPLITWG